MDALAGMEDLNPAQRRAAEYGLGDGPPGRAAPGGAAPGATACDTPPLLIIAGAGSGKTNTLAHRVAFLIRQGVAAERILLLTFTRRAAAEMKRRVERISARARDQGGPPAALAWSGTFHSVGARLLRLHAHNIGLDPAFTILDREDGADLLNLLRDELGLSGQKSRFPKKQTCLAIYSYAMNAQLPLGEVLLRAFPWCESWEGGLRRLFGAYVAAKQRQGLLDYDDLLLYWAQMMGAPELAPLVAERFDHVLVDEYQDTNALQASILLGLRPMGRGLTVVGDDAQAIYSFRAATVRNILDFPGLFSPPAAIVTLEQNYRSTQPILAASNAVIEQARERFTKSLFSERASQQQPRLVTVHDDRAQAGYVVTRVLAAREAGTALKQQAVLFRASHHSGALELELARRNIPFVKFGGLKFVEASHVKDVIGLLRWVENPRDRVAGFRSLHLLPGVGPATARKALDHLEGAGFALDALAGFKMPPAAAEDWPGLAALLALLAGRAVDWSAQLGLVKQWYRPQLERLYDGVAARLSDLDQLEAISTTYAGRQAFLEDVMLDPPAASGEEAGAPLLDEDYLILSTIHSAKGQEWKSVHVLNVVDGCIPSDLAVGEVAEIEEERRLLYVAMTRAKDELHLIHPQRFFTQQQPRHGDRHVYAPRSRFITAAMLDRFERIAWVAGSPGEASRDGRAEPRIDVASRLRDMWK
ncbi:MAG TPA: ATP-dependent helicase [Verrucomicrobiae bacterium]|nr:ATP-dependent helicase [Verrucomicrobiae bacterium]